MDSYERLLSVEPHSLAPAEKEKLFKEALAENFEHHFNHCVHYQKLCKKRGWIPPLKTDFRLEDFPYLPVEIFKSMRLSSVPDDKIVRTVQSSATSLQTPSMVVLDNETRKRQMKTLVWFLSDRLGKSRRPFVIFDVDPKTISPGQGTISARTAAVRGFLIAASSAEYCMSMDQAGEMHVELARLESALKKAQDFGKPAVIFGYTYVFYVYAAKELQKRGVKFNLPHVTILHIGGWKKLQSQAVSKKIFNQTMCDVFGVETKNIIDCYGFTEQLGVVYLDGEDGLKRTSSVSEVIVRDPVTLLPVTDGKEGLLQFISPLPLGYPGHAILTDDVGRILSREKGDDGREGTSFEILGRRKTAEIRGCGDILSEKIKANEAQL
jgi:hypothetical protein